MLQLIGKTAAALLLVSASRAGADEPVSPARLRRLAAAGWWPAGVSAELQSGGTVRTGSIESSARDALNGAQVHSAVSGAGAAITGQLPGAASAVIGDGAPSAAQVELVKALRGVETSIREQLGLALELDQATGDYVSMVLGKNPRELLKPFLLYLAEKSVIAAAEVDGFLTEPEPSNLLARLRHRINAAHEKRAGLEVQRYFMLERLEKVVGEPGSR